MSSQLALLAEAWLVEARMQQHPEVRAHCAAKSKVIDVHDVNVDL